MKKFYVAPLLLCLGSLIADEQEDATQQYRNKKAYEAIIHDAYYEAKSYDQELPSLWKEALEKFGFKEDEINFYTATRFNDFVERVGNSIVLLYPNFFLYLTEQEQAAYIAFELASLKRGQEHHCNGSHETFSSDKKSSFPKKTAGIAAAGLAALHYSKIIAITRALIPALKNTLTSVEAAWLGACFSVYGAKRMSQRYDEEQEITAAEYDVIDAIGADGLLSIREKQAHWDHLNRPWLVNKWHYLIGALYLDNNAENSVERIREYAANK